MKPEKKEPTLTEQLNDFSKWSLVALNSFFFAGMGIHRLTTTLRGWWPGWILVGVAGALTIYAFYRMLRGK